jgi:hypothetical protein
MVTANSVNAQMKTEKTTNTASLDVTHHIASDRNRAFRRPIPLLGNDALDVLSGKNVEFNLTFARAR